MDVVKSVQEWLTNWTSGGEGECRAHLLAHHTGPASADALDTLFTAYQTLLFATLASWPSGVRLTHDAFATFVQSVFAALPSSSSASPDAALLGEQLIDMIWAVDAELDEMAADIKLLAASTDADVASKAKKTKERVDTDKTSIVSIVKKLLTFQIISPRTAAERLDTALLTSAGLFPDKLLLDKKEVRTRTGLFYKQNKFNLLREQSEGYSKLTTELTSSLGPPHSSATGRPTESFDAIQERARPVWEKIISLIGYFDLDPNRALDIILDIFCTHLTTHYTFFISLLSFSPWSGSYRHREPAAMSIDSDPISYAGKSFDEILTMCGPKAEPETRADHRPRVLAQVLGFKFAYYSSPDVSEATPRNLYLTAALLIRENFITLEDLYPHLSLFDADMDEGLKAYKTDVAARIAAAKVSTLAMAAPLESSSSSSSRPKPAAPTVDQKIAPENRDAPTQKSGLVSALLSIGSIKPGLWILSKYPWMVDAHQEIADLLIRILKVSINELYETLLVTRQRNPSFLQPRNRYGNAGVVASPSRKQTLTVWAPAPPCTHTTDFVFFFPDWAEYIPMCRSLEDLIDVVEPFLKFIKLHVSRDVIFLTKFLRLGRRQVTGTVPEDKSAADRTNPIRVFWLNVMRSNVLPGLSLLRGNAVINVEVWNIIKLYEIEERWSLYGEWKSSAYEAHTELSVRRVEADRESKAVLRRLSHNTIDSLSGAVAKLAHSNPCIFFPSVVNQVMAYDNLATVVILALHYVTVMGFDVLVYVIVDAFSNSYKERVKDDGVNISDWLQSLASFSGMLFRRYGADLHPILSYIAHQLQNQMTTEIVVLRELMSKMAGIKPLYGLAERDIAAMAGGPALRIEVLASETRGSKADPYDSKMKGPTRLGTSLVDTKLGTPILILLAQQRQSAIFTNNSAHLKSLASLYDTTHEVLMQYLELLTTPSVVTFNDYVEKILPSLGDLAGKYGICPSICMQVLRPVLHQRLLTSALAQEERNRLTANEAQEKRLKAALKAKQDTTTSRVASPSLAAEDSEATKAVESMEVDTKPTLDEDAIAVDYSPTHVATPKSPWVPELEVLFDDLKRVIPEKIYNVIGPGFYLTFWQLSSYDLTPPSQLYEDVLNGMYKNVTDFDKKIKAAEDGKPHERRQVSAIRERRKRVTDFIQTLNTEYKEQTTSRASTIKRLAVEKYHWFSHAPGASALVEALIEHCIIPRCLLSPMDADYTAQMIRILHTSGTPGFQTLVCYNTILGDMSKVILFSCSEYEAKNYGRFLRGLLGDLFKWHSDEKVYLSDNRSRVGDKVVHHPGFENKNGNGHLSWPDFHRILRKWHTKLVQAFTACLETGEFMHVYNSILVLNELLPVFPVAAVAAHAGTKLTDALNVFLAKEKRGDLTIIGKTYASNLKSREAIWTPPAPSANASGSSTAATPPVKPRNVLPNGPSGAANERRNTGTPTQSTPMGPRAVQALPAAPSGPSEAPAVSATPKPVIEGPTPVRPPVIKRTQREHDTSPRPSSTDRPIPTAPATRDEHSFRPAVIPRRNSPMVTEVQPSRALPKDTTPVNLSALGKEPPKSPRNQRVADEKAKVDVLPTMPPPATPSQTQSAQELRETARQTSTRLNDKVVEEKPTPKAVADVRGQNGSATASPRPRSTSPSSRPGTRNSSADSRGSRPRKGDSGDDKKSKDRERDTSRSRRDSVTHTRTPREKDDRDRDRSGKDRHGDRDSSHKDRDRDRERGGDRHRKDRDGNRTGAVVPVKPDRPEEVGLGKRRRSDEDLESSSKRSSRKDGHSRDDRTSRRPDKERYERDGRDRGGRSEHDRRRRDHPESESRGGSSEKNGDGKRADFSGSSRVPPSTPAGPRAERSGKPETSGGGHDRHRDGRDSSPRVGPKGSVEGPAVTSNLLARIGGIPLFESRDEADRNRKRGPPDRDDIPGLDEPLEAHKRQKIDRSRYTGGGGRPRKGVHYSAITDHLSQNRNGSNR